MGRIDGAGGKRRVAAGLVVALAVGVTLGACGSGSPSANSTTTTMAANSTLPDITKAVVAYQSSQGIPASRYLITGINVSTVDPTWARFAVGPSNTDRATFQGGYGFVHRSAGRWRVTGFGTAQVGCPLTGSTTPAAVTYVVVPPAVLAAFGLPCPSPAPPRPSTTTTTSAPATTTTAASAVSAVTAAVNAYQASQGILPAQYTLTSVAISTVDPTWARWSVGPSSNDQATFQGGYGFAHQSGGTWTVVGFGSAEVGCPPGAAGNAVVPAPVLSGFNLTCPPTTT